MNKNQFKEIKLENNRFYSFGSSAIARFQAYLNFLSSFFLFLEKIVDWPRYRSRFWMITQESSLEAWSQGICSIYRVKLDIISPP